MAASIDVSQNVVVDASFVLSYLLPDECNDFAKGVFLQYQKRKINFVSASLLPYEVINGLKSALVQKRIGLTKAKFLIGEFLKLDFILERTDEAGVFNLAILKKISIYDASYLWLAKSKRLPLLTLDKRLANLVKRI